MMYCIYYIFNKEQGDIILDIWWINDKYLAWHANSLFIDNISHFMNISNEYIIGYYNINTLYYENIKLF